MRREILPVWRMIENRKIASLTPVDKMLLNGQVKVAVTNRDPDRSRQAIEISFG